MTHRTQHTVLLRAKIYLSERTQTKSSKERDTWGKVQRKPGAHFQGVESHRSNSMPPARGWDNPCNAIYLGSPLETEGPGFFPVDVHRNPLLDVYQIPDSRKKRRCLA